MYRNSKLIKSVYNSMRNAITSKEQSCSTLAIEDMPHPKSLPLIGTKLDFLLAGRGTKLHEYIDERHQNLGPIFYEKLGGNTELVFISDPALMKSLFLNLEGKHPAHILPEPWILYEKLYGSRRGLFFMNGEEWLNNRRIMNKHLLRENSQNWFQDPTKETVQKFVANWKLNSSGGKVVVDLESAFYRLSIDVIITILLGSNTSLKSSKYSEELLTTFSETVKKIFQTTTQLYALPVNWYQRLNLKVWRDFKNSVDTSLFLAQKIVNEMLLKRHDGNGLISKICEENMDNELIKRIVADLIIAAGDTTAYTSLWILHLLSKNEEVIKELRSKDPSYVKCVVKETMRLFPVAPFLTRILTKESVLGPYKLVAGTPIIASIYTSGRNEQNFTKANMFLPYRWDRDDPRRNDLVNHVPSASLPFALGARSCIGKKIAMVQLTEVVHQIVENFDLKCLNKTEVNPVTTQVLVPNKPIKILVSLRKY